MAQQVTGIPRQRAGIPVFGIIASIMPTSIPELVSQLKRCEHADTIELRLDQLTYTGSHWVDCIMRTRKRLIITLRASEENGCSALSAADVARYWANAPADFIKLIRTPAKRVAVDMSMRVINHYPKNGMLCIPYSHIGVSEHDFKCTPTEIELKHRLNILRQTKAQAFVKFVCTRAQEGDWTRMLRLPKLYSDDDKRPLIFFLMGENGRHTRIECLTAGSAGTYACIDANHRTAPGQLTIDELRMQPTIKRALGLPDF